MLKWLKSKLRERRQIKSDALALGAARSDIRRARGGRNGVISFESKYGRLHIRPNETDFNVVRQVFIDHEYDFGDTAQMQQLTKCYQALLDAGETPVIIDAGANIGAASIWFSRLFEQAMVAAIEPDPNNFDMTRRNIAAFPNVVAFHAAIGSESGCVDVESNPGHAWGTRTHRSETGLQIITVPEIVAQFQNGRLLTVKVDIEGFESDLFSSNLDWIDDAAAIIIEPHDWMLPGKRTSQSFQSALMGKGRELLIVGENLVFI